jgi:hypothetical protein
VTYERRDVQEPYHYSDGGVSLDGVRDEVLYRLTCDRCERASPWFQVGPTMRDTNLGSLRLTTFEPPHQGFYEVNGDHFCEDCFRRPVMQPPTEGSLWWSRERPRHVVRIVRTDLRVVEADVVYHPMSIGSVQRIQRTGIAINQFRLSYIQPEPDAEERAPGWVWFHLGRGQSVTLQQWGDEMVRVRSTPTLAGQWLRSVFLDEFVPSTEIQRRSWAERIMEDDDVV